MRRMRKMNEKYIKDFIEKYQRESEVCVGEFLAWEEVPQGMTFEQAFEVYIEVMKRVEGDKFLTIKEGKTYEL